MIETMQRVSVLLCTANRPVLLERALAALAAGNRRPDEVVVVNGGDATTNRVVERYASAFACVTLIQYANRNLAVSRNIGLPHCSGDVVAMTDDDAVVAPDWLQRLEAVFADDPAVGVVGGPVQGMRDNSFLSRVADCVVFPTFTQRRLTRTVPGVNVAYRREVIDRVGPYDETLFRGEDVDYNWRAQRLGYQVLYDPAIRVSHEHRASFRALLQQQYMYGRAYVLVRRKWPDLYCVYPHRLRTAHDVMKGGHFVLAVIYQPAIAARRLGAWRDAIVAYPLLFAHHLVWKLGMLRQLVTRPVPATSSETPGSIVNRWESREVRS